MKSSIIILAVILLTTCSGVKDEKKGVNETTTHASVKLDQYMVEGQKLYLQYCANCHQPTGTGLGKLYPPLAKADFLKENKEASICIVKYGRQGPLVVNGVTYNQLMPGVPTLTPLEVAEIITYVSNSWGNEQGLTPVTEVEKVLKTCEP